MSSPDWRIARIRRRPSPPAPAAASAWRRAGPRAGVGAPDNAPILANAAAPPSTFQCLAPRFAAKRGTPCTRRRRSHDLRKQAPPAVAPPTKPGVAAPSRRGRATGRSRAAGGGLEAVAVRPRGPRRSAPCNRPRSSSATRARHSARPRIPGSRNCASKGRKQQRHGPRRTPRRVRLCSSCTRATRRFLHVVPQPPPTASPTARG
mmetsp:Transcript_88351/g.248878  ORF Transcript_88351/g.248878 Transcript_88351/m.248878 type:complete len:205 (-) Transcript_88351:1387-2001(-)